MSLCRGWTLDNSPAQLPPSLGKGHAKGGGTFQTHQGEWQGKVTKPGHRPNTVHHDNDDHKILSGEAVQLGGGGESGDVLFLSRSCNSATCSVAGKRDGSGSP